MSEKGQWLESGERSNLPAHRTDDSLIPGMGYEVGDVFDFDDNLPAQPQLRGMLVIQLGSRGMAQIDVEITVDWLMAVLPVGPREQVEQCALVIVTDPNARVSKVVKNEVEPDEYLEMHTAALG